MRIALACLIVALAAPSSALASGGVWTTEHALLHATETRGITLDDGSHIRPVSGFCIGYGPHRGTYASPRFIRFRCTLVTLSRYGTSTWYDLNAFPLPGIIRGVVIHRY